MKTCSPEINDELEITKEDVAQLKEFVVYIGLEGFDTLNERGGFRKSMKLIRLMEKVDKVLDKWITYVPDDDGAEEIERHQPLLQ
ncbi:regulator of RNase E activity RraB [Rhizobium pisi]|uniref:Regulator of RNase E activity RraB n=1 Tax=Rhizobium pisi TaxID=574561 RepID=A0A427MXJ9_9HYPH|nr:hypothetical protein [Rhizobium pisi]MBB3136020.1 regulator of RNase E activity RraB [Rhizobium pisi]RSB75874.1 hypothetical protein EFD55_18890 [Rhizobium pisi]TCA55279.1 hypothetical protein E0J16_16365 [Rhizobium pisi]